MSKSLGEKIFVIPTLPKEGWSVDGRDESSSPVGFMWLYGLDGKNNGTLHIIKRVVNIIPITPTMETGDKAFRDERWHRGYKAMDVTPSIDQGRYAKREFPNDEDRDEIMSPRIIEYVSAAPSGVKKHANETIHAVDGPNSCFHAKLSDGILLVVVELLSMGASPRSWDILAIIWKE
jgi:hypothetical protein